MLYFVGLGEMSEWFKELVLKTSVPETVPWVRIPLSPPELSNDASPVPTKRFTEPFWELFCMSNEQSSTITLMDGNGQPTNDGGSWQFKPNSGTATAVVSSPGVTPRSVASPPSGPGGTITWTASEFVAHQKSSGWYVILAVGSVIAAAIVYLLTRDIVSSLIIPVCAVALGVLAARQPRELMYRLDDSGLTIGSKHLPYSTFRSFAVMREGAFSSIVFVPLKRFAMLTTIYYDPNDEEKIVALLSDRLPLETREHDAIDRLMWRIRF